MTLTHIFHGSFAMTPFSDRLSALRKSFPDFGIGGFLVPRSDEHLGEYVPASAERLAWLSGFTGSAGLAIVLPERAALFTDGRYVLQVRREADERLWEFLHIVDQPPSSWLKAHAPAGARIGYDPLLISEDAVERIAKGAPLVVLVPLDHNPIDRIWQDRPAPPVAPASVYPLELAGRSAANKRADIAAILKEAGEDAAVITDPPAINWLLNIRGADVPFAPIALGFLIIQADASATLFMEPGKIDGDGAGASRQCGDRRTAGGAGRSARQAGRESVFGSTIRPLRSGSPNACARRGPRSSPAPIPARSRKPAKIRWNRKVPARPRRGMRWRSAASCTGCRSARRPGRRPRCRRPRLLVAFRAEAPEFREESFPAISGAGEHAAIMHYRVSPESDRRIAPNEIYLIDSGAQYPDGTTDVTRTIWTGPDAAPDSIRDHVTRVLKGHIAIATLRFPEGVGGSHLDAFARHALWSVGLDFDHGTGHGVGAYLSVHEGPMSFSRNSRPIAFKTGMLLSNEPGYYLPGAYGIRLENLLIVQPSASQPGGVKPFLEFETITLAPFDRALIEPTLLTAAERDWLDAYHARVLAEVGPKLPAAVKVWLTAACAPL